MATVLKVRRISNPRGRRRRSNPRRVLSAKQVKIFGTPAQKAALKRSRAAKRAASHRTRTRNPRRPIGVLRRVARRRKRSNPALVATLGALNPRRRSRMARRRKRSSNPRRRTRRVAYRRRRRAVAVNPRRRRRRVNTHRRRTRRNPVVVVTRRRRRVNRRRSSGGRRRRNPIGLFGGSLTSKRTMTLIGGGITGVVAAKFIPTMLPVGMLGSLGSSQIGRVVVTGGSAVLAGWAAGKFVGSDFGDGVLFGGLMQTASVALNSFLPGIYSQLGIGLGDLMSGSFPVPQNPIRAAIPPPAPVNARIPMSGLARAYGSAY